MKLRQGAVAWRGGAASVNVTTNRDPALTPALDGEPPTTVPAESQPSDDDAQPAEDA